MIRAYPHYSRPLSATYPLGKGSSSLLVSTAKLRGLAERTRLARTKTAVADLRRFPSFSSRHSPQSLTMTDHSPNYSSSVRQLDDSYRTLANACSRLPEESEAHKIVKQLGFHIDGFVGQEWPSEVNSGLAEFYSDLAMVIKNALEWEGYTDAARQSHVERLLVRHPSCF